MEAREQAAWVKDSVGALKSEIGRAIVGQQSVVEDVLLCLFCGGHALLEGVPGLGKTTLIRCLGQVLDLQTSRIQFPGPDAATSSAPTCWSGGAAAAEPARKRGWCASRRDPSSPTWCWRTRSTAPPQDAVGAPGEAMQERTVTVAGRPAAGSPFIVLAAGAPSRWKAPARCGAGWTGSSSDRLGYPSAEEIAAIVDRTTAGSPPLSRVMDGAAIARVKGSCASARRGAVKDFAIAWHSPRGRARRRPRAGQPLRARRAKRAVAEPRAGRQGEPSSTPDERPASTT
jgi:MoxR-like ATPase